MMEKISYNELVKLKTAEESIIKYVDLLNTTEWVVIRNEIVKRDHETCQVCNARPTQNIRGKHYRELTEDEVNEKKLLNQVNHQLMLEEYKDYPEVVEFIKKSHYILPSTTPSNPIYLHVHHKYYIFGHKP